MGIMEKKMETIGCGEAERCRSFPPADRAWLKQEMEQSPANQQAESYA